MAEKRNLTPVHIGDALQQFLQFNGDKRRNDAQQVILDWDAAVGEHLARSATPVSIKEGVLTIRPRDSVWRTELLMRRTEMIQKINKHFKAELVRTIVIS